MECLVLLSLKAVIRAMGTRNNAEVLFSVDLVSGSDSVLFILFSTCV